jgi:hypothetical protein
VLDSGCTNHISGERSMFQSYSLKLDSNENIIFGDNSRGDVLGLGKVTITLEHSITNVLRLFTDKGVEVFRRDDSSIVFMG